MVTHMKTTIEIPDALLAQARSVADKRGTTLRALVEAGLRKVLSDRGASGFRLRRVSVSGEGLHAGIREGDWNALRDLSYDGRGA